MRPYRRVVCYQERLTKKRAGPCRLGQPGLSRQRAAMPHECRVSSTGTQMMLPALALTVPPMVAPSTELPSMS